MPQSVAGIDGVWRDEFPGVALKPIWTARTIGAGGGSASVAGSLLTLATGPTSGGGIELVAPLLAAKPPCRLIVSLSSISQRIVNQEFEISLIRKDTPVDAAPVDGVGLFFVGTTATTIDMRSYSQGDLQAQNGVAGVTTAGIVLYEIDLTIDEVWLYNGTPDASGTSKTNAIRFTRKVPDPSQSYMVRLRAKNTGVPAGSTNFIVDSVLVEDYNSFSLELARARGGQSAGEQLPVNVLGLPISGSVPVAIKPNAIWWDDSVATLGGAATFTGTGRDLLTVATATPTQNSGTSTNLYPARFRGWSDSDQIGTLIAEVSRDNVTFRAVLVVPTAVVDGRNIATFDIPVYSRYARVRYVNGATPQTSFTLGTQAVAIS